MTGYDPHAWRMHDLSGGPTLGILRYGTSPTWPARQIIDQLGEERL